MTGITLEKPVENMPSGIGVPEIVRFKVEQCRRFAQRITIDVRDPTGKFGKVNGFKLGHEKGLDGYPAQEVDEICEAIMWAVLAAWAERNAAEPDLSELEFKVTFDQRKPDGTRTRPSCEFEYNPAGPDTSPTARVEGEEVRSHVIDQLLDLVRALTVHLDNAHARIIESNQGQEKLFEPFKELSSMMFSTYTAGMEMQRRALDYMYNTKRIEEEELAKDRRQQALLKFLERPFKTALKQFAKFAGQKAAKVGIGVDEKDDDDDDDDDVPAGDPSEAQASASDPSSSAAPPKAPSPPTAVEHAGAELMRAFGMMISADQWLRVPDILTKKEVGILRALAEVKTDQEALDAWNRLAGGAIKLEKLLALQELLTAEQRAHFEDLEKVMDLIEESGCGADGAMNAD